MKVYEVKHDDFGKATFHYGTRDEGHQAMKADAKERWEGYMMTELEVQTDKEGVLALINRRPLFTMGKAWQLTPRGGLKECPQ